MKQSMAVILPALAWVGLMRVCGEERRTHLQGCFSLRRRSCPTPSGARGHVPVVQLKTPRSDSAQSARLLHVLQSSRRWWRRGRALPFLGVPAWILHQLRLHIVSRRQNDTLTLQVDKCDLTTLGEISTWSAGSLPGTHFYLHLLRLAEETLHLLRDLWLPF